MALRGTRIHIARDANNIGRVEDEGNIVSIEGNVFLYPPKKSHPILLLLLLYILGFVCNLTLAKQSAIVSDCQLPFFSVYKQRVRSAHMRRAIIVGQYSRTSILILKWGSNALLWWFTTNFCNLI